MRVIKVDGTRRKYIIDNGDEVDFDDMNYYMKLKKAKPKKNKTTRKKKIEKIEEELIQDELEEAALRG